MASTTHTIASSEVEEGSNHKVEEQQDTHRAEPQAEDAEQTAYALGSGAHKAPESRGKMDVQVAHGMTQLCPFLDAAAKFGQPVHHHHNADTCTHNQHAEVVVFA